MANDHNPVSLREEIDRFITAGALERGALRMAELWRREPSAATASFLVTRLDKVHDRLPLIRYRIAILRSFTVEPIVPLLRACAFANGIDLSVHLGDFNVYAQEILERESSLYRYAPDAVILAVRTQDLAPELWSRFADLSPEAVTEAALQASRALQGWISAFRERSTAALIVHSLEQPFDPSNGILDSQFRNGQIATLQQINRELQEKLASVRGVYILDYDALVARHGLEHWHDERRWLTARLPIAANQLIHLAREWMRFLVPLSGKTVKTVVVDLDNTLWGGIVGEDGVHGIKIGPEYPGAAYLALQRVLLDLSRRGILLAICSKNNPDDALEALDQHPEMLLRSKDFAAVRINWQDKASNLREIAQELNIGIDALAFVDDNPFECEQVRVALPEVTVIELPTNPVEYASALRQCPGLERLTLSSEDQQRTSMYAEQRLRSQAEQSFQTKEDFFRYLQQVVQLEPVNEATLARVAQLTQKTNQFNLTTRRYTEQEVAQLMNTREWRVLSIRVT